MTSEGVSESLPKYNTMEVIPESLSTPMTPEVAPKTLLMFNVMAATPEFHVIAAAPELAPGHLTATPEGKKVIQEMNAQSPSTATIFPTSTVIITSSAEFQTSTRTKPVVIRNLTVSEITTSSVFLKWDEPVENRSFFKLQWTGYDSNEILTNHTTTSNTSYNITGLTAGVNYTFNITAVAADNVTEGQPIRISVYTKPDVIMNLTVDNITTSSVSLNWTKPNGQSSHYRVEYENINVTINETTEKTFITINNLIPGSQYTFKVFTVAADNVTEGRSDQISHYTKPDVIRNIIVSDITTSSVFLKWDEPIGNRSFFKLHWTGYESNEILTNHTTTSNTSYNITGLTAGVNYTFNITAVAADNVTEGRSDQISHYTKPDEIKILKVSNITTSSVFLTWEEPLGKRSFFRVQWTDEQTFNNTTTSNTSYNITGLTAGVNYTFNITVVASDNMTEGQPIRISVYTKPDVIMNLTVDNITTSSVSLNWTKPNGQSSHYRVEYEDINVTINESTEKTFITINNLIPGSQYTFKVFTVAADNVTEGRSDQISHYTKPDEIKILKVSNITTSSVFLTWEEPLGKRSFFRVQWTDEQTFNNTTTSNTSYNITELTAGVNYTFNITAVAADNVTEGQPIRISVYTKPDVIMNLRVDNITTSSVSLNWTKPNGQSSHYRVEYENINVTINETTEKTFITINNLIPGSQYTFKVFTVAADNVTEGRSDQISRYTKPDEIKILKVSNITTSSVFLTWEEPLGKRSFFRVQWTDEQTFNNTTTSNTSYNITELTAGVNYTFNITAVAADNMTEGQPIRISVYTKPDVIMNLTVDNITTSSVSLNWTKPNGQSSHYRVEYENINVTINETTEKTFITINNLIPGSQYTFKVFTVAADNVTEGRSDQISCYTKPDVIRNLIVSDITTSSVFLKWDEPIGNRSFFKLHWTGYESNEILTNHTTTSNISYNITGLTAGVNYTFNITAVAADNVTEGQPIRISVYTKPDVIMNLTVDNITTSSVSLNWTKPNGQSSHYRVEYENINVTINETTEKTFITINNLIPGSQYTFKVFTVAADNVTEGRSDQISHYTKPDEIKILKVSNITTSSVFLTWEEPLGKRSFFRVQWTDEQTFNNTTTSNTSYNITGLTAGVNYTFNITAVAADNVTEGQPIRISVYTNPDVIMNLRVDNITTSSVSLNWTKPNGQSSHYRVEYENINVTINETTEKTFITINNLIPGSQYTFKVFTVAADNVTEGRSDQISHYTKPDVIRNIIVSDITTSSVFLKWDEPIGNRSFFKLNWTGYKTNEILTNHTTTSNTSYNITGLTAGVNYTFNITAVAADNVTEGQSIRISVYTKPDVIMNLRVDNITTSSVSLNWTKPNGQSSHYRVEYENINVTINETTEKTFITINNLIPGSQYTFKVFTVAADNVTEGRSVQISCYTSNLDKTGMFVGIALGVLCILITITLILFFYSRRKTKEKCSEIPFHAIR
ncbi:receptor-type tyrosine-protein phosphatase eta-like [Xyrauchen texanus]|uniref:receptor-type tyrosine-protein phosphatase eta-like n=1 Tax=Xyrauchen texanus TaxID=154827 RepID=UPI002241C6DC|nr:receptor-type tyrosine-protein phosphatase eta-like [Xyrauchen texanus]